MPIKIALIGANGKMGLIAGEAISELKDCLLVSKIQRQDSLDDILRETKPDMAIDLTSAESVLYNTSIIIKNNVKPLIGASGLSLENISELQKLCKSKHLGGLIIPNFSLGIAIINKFTKEIKNYYDDFSIVEFHHRQKKDKPSGTARHTSSILGTPENEIASVRSNGFVAKQQLYINNEFERIIVDHESFDRKSFIQGIQISIKKLAELNELIVGLENIV